MLRESDCREVLPTISYDVGFKLNLLSFRFKFEEYVFTLSIPNLFVDVGRPFTKFVERLAKTFLNLLQLALASNATSSFYVDLCLDGKPN